MVDILDEVLNDTKDEKRIILFRKFLPTIIILMLIGAVGMTGYNWYKNKTLEHHQRLGDILTNVISKEITDKDLSNNSLKHLVINNENRQAELADIYMVSELRAGGDNEAAILKLETIIANNKYQEITKSYARILWLSIILDQKEITDSNNVKARSYMDYFVSEDQVFFTNATLLKALFYKKSGQTELAMQYANSILNSKNSSAIIKEQATAIIANIKNNI
ncbi:MAG: DUF2659 domain-containing protein [Rickettsiales bacterium]|nr:MAG: DUF2659 domain-containing protein [Rickettsiales bacterium]